MKKKIEMLQGQPHDIFQQLNQFYEDPLITVHDIQIIYVPEREHTPVIAYMVYSQLEVVIHNTAHLGPKIDGLNSAVEMQRANTHANNIETLNKSIIDYQKFKDSYRANAKEHIANLSAVVDLSEDQKIIRELANVIIKLTSPLIPDARQKGTPEIES